MDVVIVGKRKVDYVSKKSGNAVKGTELHYTAKPSEDSDIEGLTASSIFTRLDCADVKVGGKYSFGFDLSRNDKAVLSQIKPV